MLLAFFACWSIQLISGITVRNPLTVVLFVCLYFLNNKVNEYKIERKTGYSLSGVLSALSTFGFRNQVTESFDSNLFKLIATIILFIGLYSFYFTVYKVGYVLVKRDKEKIEAKNSKIWKHIREKYYNIVDSPKKVFILTFVFCLVAWIPYFLYEFPGIMTADSLVQYEQIIATRPFSNHHPIVHTLLIKLFYKIGLVFTGDDSTALSFYTVFQMIFFAACLSRAVKEVRILLGEKGILLEGGSIIFFALVPFNAVFAVTIWKDIPFAGITILLVCHIIELRKGNGSWIIFTALCILFSLFRSNAWYAFILWTPVLIYCFRKNIVKALLTAIVVLVTVATIKGPVFNAFGVEKPDFVESLSVPISQVARVLVDDRLLTPLEKWQIERIIDTTYIHELYAPDYADNIKELVRAGDVSYLESHKWDYFKLWAGLLPRYFGDYVRAWFDLLGGYIYPDFSYAVGDIDGIMKNYYGLVWMPKIGGPAIVKAKEILIKLGVFVPIYGMLWSIGTYSWFLFISLFICIKKKRAVPEMWLLFFMLGTLLIAAPNLEFRYAYSLVLIWPVLFSVAKTS